MNRNSTGDGIEVLLRALKLPAFAAYHEEVAEQAEKQGWSFKQYLYRLAEQELEERKQRKVDRLTCAWHDADAELLTRGSEVNPQRRVKRPPLPDGRATPTRQGQFPEMGRPEEA